MCVIIKQNVMFVAEIKKDGCLLPTYVREVHTCSVISDESQLESPIITVKASLCVQLHPWPLTLFILYHTKGILMFISLLH